MRSINDITGKVMDAAKVGRAYQAVFGTEEGKLVLRHIMRNGFVIDSTFVRGDPEQTMLNEGTRRLALSIVRMAVRDNNQMLAEIQKQQQET